MSDNYPDDIRQYDNDPRSPFYDPPSCPHCGEDLIEETCPCQEEEEEDLDYDHDSSLDDISKEAINEIIHPTIHKGTNQ